MTLSAKKKERNKKNEEARKKKPTHISPSKVLLKQTTLHEHLPMAIRSVNSLAFSPTEASSGRAIV